MLKNTGANINTSGDGVVLIVYYHLDIKYIQHGNIAFVVSTEPVAHTHLSSVSAAMSSAALCWMLHV